MVNAIDSKDASLVLQLGSTFVDMDSAGMTFSPTVNSSRVEGLDQDNGRVFFISQTRSMSVDGLVDTKENNAQKIVEEVGSSASALVRLPAGTGGTLTSKAWLLAKVGLGAGDVTAPYNDLVAINGTWTQTGDWQYGKELGSGAISSTSTFTTYTVPAGTAAGSTFVLYVSAVSSGVITDTSSAGYANGIRITRDPAGSPPAASVSYVPKVGVIETTVGAGDTIAITFTQTGQNVTVLWGLVS